MYSISVFLFIQTALFMFTLWHGWKGEVLPDDITISATESATDRVLPPSKQFVSRKRTDGFDSRRAVHARRASVADFSGRWSHGTVVAFTPAHSRRLSHPSYENRHIVTRNLSSKNHRAQTNEHVILGGGTLCTHARLAPSFLSQLTEGKL